jgi:hypothetical protein
MAWSGLQLAQMEFQMEFRSQCSASRRKQRA